MNLLQNIDNFQNNHKMEIGVAGSRRAVCMSITVAYSYITMVAKTKVAKTRMAKTRVALTSVAKTGSGDKWGFKIEGGKEWVAKSGWQNECGELWVAKQEVA